MEFLTRLRQIMVPSSRQKKFKQFCLSRGIHHTTTAPYHPCSNGEAERLVQTFKQRVDKANPQTTAELLDCVTNFLAYYRSTPHSVTDQLLLKC